MSRKILPVIMCGGAGTRVWPESRETMPKQFIALIGKSSTFQETVRRVGDAIFETPIVVTNRDYRFLVREQLEEIGAQAMIVLEPSRREFRARRRGRGGAGRQARSRDGGGGVRGRSRDPRPQRVSQRLRERGRRGGGRLYRDARRHARRTGRRLRLHPAGRADRRGQGARKWRLSSRSPISPTAERYVAEGYLWNSGNFFFRADVMLEELRALRAGDGRGDGARARPRRRRPRIPRARSAGVRRRAEEVDRLRRDGAHQARGGGARGHRLVGRRRLGRGVEAEPSATRAAFPSTAKASRSIRRTCTSAPTSMLTAVVGVNDVVVVSTQDAVLVLAREQGDKVKQLVEALKKEQRREATEHKRIYRPWGYYQSIDSGPRYQVKRIVVLPGRRLSLQKHYHRAEHWVVVKGTAEVTRDARSDLVHENEFDLPADRRRSPARQSRQDQSGADRGADGLVSRRRRHRAHRGRLQPAAELRPRANSCSAARPRDRPAPDRARALRSPGRGARRAPRSAPPPIARRRERPGRRRRAAARLGLSSELVAPPRDRRTPPSLDDARGQAAGLEEARAPQPDVDPAGLARLAHAATPPDAARRRRLMRRARRAGEAAGLTSGASAAKGEAAGPRRRRLGRRSRGAARDSASARSPLRARRKAEARAGSASAWPGFQPRFGEQLRRQRESAPACSGAARASASSRSSAEHRRRHAGDGAQAAQRQRLGRRRGMRQAGQRVGRRPPARPRQLGEDFAEQPRLAASATPADRG